MKRLPTTSIVILSALVGLWLYPDFIAPIGVAAVLSIAYGYLLAQFFTNVVRYGLLHWGINRAGVMTLSAALFLFTTSIAYFAWVNSYYSWFGFVWIFAYTAFETGMTAYRRRSNVIFYEILLTLQYAVVSLMALALFGSYIQESPIGQLELQYAGLEGEVLLSLAIMMLLCETAYQTYLFTGSKLKRVYKKVITK